MKPTAMQKVEAMRLGIKPHAGPATIDSVRDLYRAFRSRCGWPSDEIAEMDGIIKADVAEGPGAERPFAFPRQERLDCWANWLKVAR